MNAQAVTYLALGRVSDAIKLLEETRTRRQRARGENHPDTLQSMNDLANAYNAAGHIKDAIDLHEKTLAARQHFLGETDPDTLQSMNDLADSYAKARRIEDARVLHKRTLKLARKELGPRHPVTLKYMNNLAVFFLNAHNISRALVILEETLPSQVDEVGRQNPATLRTMNNLAMALGLSKRFPDAIRISKAALDIRISRLGQNHPDTLENMNNLAEFCIQAKQFTEARSTLEKVRDLWRARAEVTKIDADTARVAWTQGQFGELAEAQFDFEIAKCEYEDAVEKFAEIERSGTLSSFFQGRRQAYQRKIGECALMNQAVQGLESALALPPEKVSSGLNILMNYRLSKHDYDGALKAAAKAREVAGTDANQIYNAACDYCLCAAAFATSGRREAKELQAESINLLTRAVELGFRDVAQMKVDEDLVDLHSRPEFKELIDDLERRMIKPPNPGGKKDME